jgi:damage-control phosphatase, subfamily I
MKTYLECLPCFLKQAVQAAQLATEDTRLQHAAVRAVLERLRDVPLDMRPVDITPAVHSTVRHVTGCKDPYRRMKDDSNMLALRAYPAAAEIVSKAGDPLLVAARIAAAGNIADAAIGRRFDFDTAVRHAATTDFACNDYGQFKADASNAGRVLYLADNAGEIVFDRLLLEHLHGAQCTVAVKSRPILNRVDPGVSSVGQEAPMREEVSMGSAP